MKTYDFKVEGSFFSIFDIEEKRWIDVPARCTYYGTIANNYHNMERNNKKCKVDELARFRVKSAAKEYIHKHLKGRTRSFFELPFRSEK